MISSGDMFDELNLRVSKTYNFVEVIQSWVALASPL